MLLSRGDHTREAAAWEEWLIYISSARLRIRNKQTDRKKRNGDSGTQTTPVDRQGRCRGLIGGGRERRYSAWTLRDNVATAYKE